MFSIKLSPYLFLVPFLILFSIFGVFPIVFSLYLAFHTWDPVQGLDSMHYVGWGNFMFTLSDDWFWKSVKNTFWLAFCSGIPQHLVAIPLAAFINSALKKGRNLVVGVYFLPYITSTVAIAIMFTALFSTDYGLVNQTLNELSKLSLIGQLLPVTNIDWLNNPDNVKPSIAFIVFWRYLGFNTVLYLAAMQSIPKDLYEAASIDGASPIKQFFYITLPMLKPMIFFGVTLSIIGGLQLFEEPFILTGGKGGTDQAGMTTAIYLFRSAFEFNDFGAASAISWILFIMIVALTYITHSIFKTK